MNSRFMPKRRAGHELPDPHTPTRRIPPATSAGPHESGPSVAPDNRGLERHKRLLPASLNGAFYSVFGSR
jgi:hypothetical protein